VKLKQKININFFIFILFVLIIYFLIKHQIIYPTILPMIYNGGVNIFADWSVIINANLCFEKGLDVYSNNPCDQWGRKHVYGNILLNIPFIQSFKNFYFFIFPILFNLLFLYVTINFFKFKNYIEYLMIFPFMLSPSIILSIERANIDIIIFLIVVFISFNKKLLFNYIPLIFVTLSKFYPISLATIFLFEKKFSKIILNLIVFFILIISLLYLQYDELVKIFNNSKQFTGGGIYNFSFNGLALYITSLNIIIDNKNLNWIKYLCIFIFLIIPILITLRFQIRFIFKNYIIKDKLTENIYENRLYLLSSVVLLSCYFLFSNYIYREIFFLGLIPWILKEREINSNKNFINFYYYILCTKFVISFIITYIIRNEYFLLIKPILIFIKHSFDFYLITIILIFLLSAIIFFYRKLRNNQVPQNV
tara:strand:- start:307 stop:1569 length:1263 start_codon:yes stop_codon:yes gene_type:complete